MARDTKLSEEEEEREEIPLSKAAQYLLEECRMVLPGIQALFGFQLIAVFNAGFREKVGPVGEQLHLVAMALVVIAVALVMTPAAYHRQTRPREVSERFITVSTRLLLFSMLPLALAICLDFYIVGRVLVEGAVIPSLTAVLFGLFVVLWIVLPRSARLKRLIGGRRREVAG